MSGISDLSSLHRTSAYSSNPAEEFDILKGRSESAAAQTTSVPSHERTTIFSGPAVLQGLGQMSASMKANIAEKNRLNPIPNNRARPLFRTDTRHPSQIFREGFRPRGNSLDIAAHTHAQPADAGGSHFVSATHDPEFALSHGYVVAEEQNHNVNFVYKLSRRVQGVDVGATAQANSRALTLDDHGENAEGEVLIPGGVNQRLIKTAWEMTPDGAIKQKLKNTNYVGSDKGDSDTEMD